MTIAPIIANTAPVIGSVGSALSDWIREKPSQSQVADNSVTKPEMTDTAARMVARPPTTETVVDVTAAIAIIVNGVPGNPFQPTSSSCERVVGWAWTSPHMYHGYAAAARDRTAPKPMSATGEGPSGMGTGARGGTDSRTPACLPSDLLAATTEKACLQVPQMRESGGLMVSHRGHLMPPTIEPQTTQSSTPGALSNLH